MGNPRTTEGWIVELRNRTEALDRKIGELLQDRDGVKAELEQLARLVKSMATGDEVANAVAEKLQERRRFMFSIWTKIGAAVVAVSSVANLFLTRH